MVTNEFKPQNKRQQIAYEVAIEVFDTPGIPNDVELLDIYVWVLARLELHGRNGYMMGQSRWYKLYLEKYFEGMIKYTWLMIAGDTRARNEYGIY